MLSRDTSGALSLGEDRHMAKRGWKSREDWDGPSIGWGFNSTIPRSASILRYKVRAWQRRGILVAIVTD